MSDQDDRSQVPEKVKDTLADLSAKQASAVRHYFDRSSPAFGNKSKAVEMAGYAPSTRSDDVWESKKVQRATKAIRMEMLHREGFDVIEDIEALSGDARDVLMHQIRQPEGMDFIDPRDIFGENLERLVDGVDETRLREINRWNQNLIRWMKEQRSAAETILAYAEGTPEQRVRMEHSQGGDPIQALMSELPFDKFVKVGRIIFGDEFDEIANIPDDKILEAESEVVDYDTDEESSG